MASTSSSIISAKISYDVFLSFRGIDTRTNFTSHLYAALHQKNITAFMDDNLDRGEEISLTLLKAIEESKISVIIFSENYASSRWCLDELVKIMDCMKTIGRMVLPIFYHVPPFDVRHQIGNFGEAFAEVKEKFKESRDKVERWSTALREAANLSGWDSSNYRLESELSEIVAEAIMKKLYPISFIDSADLFGIDSHIEKILTLLHIESMDVRFIGIWGMGGIGKTTIAEALVSQISNEFDHCCFFRNVREKSEKFEPVHLRKSFFSELLGIQNPNIQMLHVLPTYIKDLLSRMKVLIVLDDISDPNQLDALSVNDGWFGSGSRIILTSRDKQVLSSVDDIYKVEGLNDDDALQLFCAKAFKQKHPLEDYTELLDRVVNYAKGVPLALKVLGSHLCKRSPKEWEIALNKLKLFPDSNIQKILEISYDELDLVEKDIFLDIACFFKGNRKDWLENILDGCGFPWSWGIIRLADKCLITIVDNIIEMHDLIQEMGQDIAQRKGGRLWNSKDIYNMLRSNMGNKSIQGILLDMSKIGKVNLSHEAFSSMPNLRLLKFYWPRCCPRNKDTIFIVESAQSNYLKCLSNKLSLLHWEDYPYKSLPLNFSMENLVELNLSRSKIVQLWNGNKCPQNLKWLNLSKSVHLRTLPDLSSATNLELMDLWGCESLLEIPSSIQYLHKLNRLHLHKCKKLRSLPSLIKLKSLRVLRLSYCPDLKVLPEIPRGIEELELQESGLEEWFPSVPFLDRLQTLSMRNCKNLRTLPSLIHLKSLKTLDLSWCSNLKMVPEIPRGIEKLELEESGLEGWSPYIQFLDNLQYITMWNCKNLRSLPNSIHLNSLVKLNLMGCKNFNKFPEIIGNLKVLVLNETAIEELPVTIGCHSSLVELKMEKCERLKSLPSTISKLKRLKMLILCGCSKLLKLPPLNGLSSLRLLNVDGTSLVEIPVDIVSLSSLRVLTLNNCKRLQCLPKLPHQLKQLYALNCTLLETIVSTSFVALCQSNFCDCINLDQYARNNIIRDARMTIEEIAIACIAFRWWHDNSVRKKRQWNDNCYSDFVVGLPGSEIPKWFNYIIPAGSSIDILLSSDFFNSKFAGFAFCVVLEIEAPVVIINKYDSLIFRCEFCFKDVNGYEKVDISSGRMHLEPVVKSDVVFLWYNYQYDLNNWLLQNCCDVYKASFDFKAEYDVFKGDKAIPFNFLKLNVKRCGVHLVYADEQNDNNPGLAQTELSLHCEATNQNFLEKVTETDSNRKRRREDYFYSNQTHTIMDSDYSYEEEEPQSKISEQFSSINVD